MARRTDVFRISLTIATVLATVGSSRAWAGICAWCGGNSATVQDQIVFTQLNLNGAYRPGGPRISGARLQNVPVKLRVDGDVLSAKAPGKPPFSAAGLIPKSTGPGLVVELKMKDGRTYELHFGDYTPTDFWSTPHTKVDAFVIHVTKTHRKRNALPPKGDVYPPDDGPLFANKNLCNSHDKDDAAGPFYALSFTGDHYTERHTVTSQEAGWFNLACRGTAAAKMHLLRHTMAGAPPNHVTTLDERTTMLRAITGDYCGDGRSWTADGTPLFWTDKRDWFPLSSYQNYTPSSVLPFSKQIEAVWGLPEPTCDGCPVEAAGTLLCLNEPRRTREMPSPLPPLPPLPQPCPNCTFPVVDRIDVTKGPKTCAKNRNIPKCDAYFWPNHWRNTAFSLVPIPKALRRAYVITVNDYDPSRTRDYSGSM